MNGGNKGGSWVLRSGYGLGKEMKMSSGGFELKGSRNSKDMMVIVWLFWI